MANSFTQIDLSRLPAPDVVEALDYEAILADMLADFQARYPAYGAVVESDPVMKVLESAAYREFLVRQRVNDAARAVMLAFATGTDLDNLAALVPLARQDGESDKAFRSRVQLAPEAFSTAGPEGAYFFWARSASPTVKDVTVASPTPGDVVVTVLSATGDGTPQARETVTDLDVPLDGDSAALPGEKITGVSVTGYVEGTDWVFTPSTSTLHRVTGGGIAAGEALTVSYEKSAELELVETLLNDEDVRPLTDNVTVQAPTILTYAVDATIYVYPGPDGEVVRQASKAGADAFVADQHRLGRDVTLSGLHNAMHVPGVQRVEIATPVSGLTVAPAEAAYCTGVTVAMGGVHV